MFSCADDPEYRGYSDISQLPPHRLAEIRRFFEDYKKNENKLVVVDDFLGLEDAHRIIKESMVRGVVLSKFAAEVLEMEFRWYNCTVLLLLHVRN